MTGMSTTSQNCTWRENWNVLHSDDKLNLRHLQLHVRPGLLELKKRDHRDVHTNRLPPPHLSPLPTGTIQEPTLGAPGRRPGQM